MIEQPRRRRRRRKHSRKKDIILLFFVSFAAMFSIFALIQMFFYVNQSLVQAQTSPTPSPPPSPSHSQPDTTPVPTSAAPTASLEYDYSRPVPESSQVDRSYFDDAVLIGDSRTEGLLLYTGLTNATGYTYKGLMVDTAFTKPVINQDGETKPVMEALKTTQFSKVYIMLGINELGWAYPHLFVEKYTEMIETIRTINPNAIIYIQEILPVSQQVSTTHSYITNEKILQFNQMLQQLALQQQVYYLEVSSAVEDDTGCLPEEASPDGIHLTKAYCEKWLDYLQTHTIT